MSAHLEKGMSQLVDPVRHEIWDVHDTNSLASAHLRCPLG
nr:hypothetical protein [Kibdelosporangium sp. MJ126-NF4]